MREKRCSRCLIEKKWQENLQTRKDSLVTHIDTVLNVLSLSDEQVLYNSSVWPALSLTETSNVRVLFCIHYITLVSLCTSQFLRLVYCLHFFFSFPLPVLLRQRKLNPAKLKSDDTILTRKDTIRNVNSFRSVWSVWGGWHWFSVLSSTYTFMFWFCHFLLVDTTVVEWNDKLW